MLIENGQMYKRKCMTYYFVNLFNYAVGENLKMLHIKDELRCVAPCCFSVHSRSYDYSQDMKKFSLYPEPDTIEESGSGTSLRQLAVYDVQAALVGDPFSIEATYKSRHIYGIIPPPNLHVSRFITGRKNINISLYLVSQPLTFKKR